MAMFIFIFVRSLSFTMEINQHNVNGAKGNKVFIKEDDKGGCKEAVFSSDGSPVIDSENKPSYNYYCFYKNPIRHFFADTLPWIFLGNARDDSTNFFERVVAFLKDFFNGFLMSFKNKN